MPKPIILPEVQSERSLSISEALRLSANACASLDATLLETEILPDATPARVVSIHLNQGGRKIGEGTGKGIGDQALASAVFEAIEHAAARGFLTPTKFSSSRLTHRPNLKDTLYAYAVENQHDGLVETVRFVPLLPAQGKQDHSLFLHYPRILVDMSYRAEDVESPLYFLDRHCTTNGFASGVTIEDALMHALNEVLERDAISEMMLVGYHPDARSPENLLGPFPESVMKVVAQIESFTSSTVRLARLPSTDNVVIAATAGHGDEIDIGTGCSSLPAVAMERAVTELLQECVARHSGLTYIDEGGDDPDVSLQDYPVLRKLLPIRVPHAAESVSFPSISGYNPNVLESAQRLEAKGFNVYWRPVWSYNENHKFGVHVVQIIVPGLEHFTDLVMGRAVVPTGRLSSTQLTKELTTNVL